MMRQRRRWSVVLVGSDVGPTTVTDGPRWWCRMVARISNAIVTPVPDLRYEVRGTHG